MTKEEAEVTLKVNDQAAIDEFNKLEKKAESLRAKFAEAFKKGDTRSLVKINQELSGVNKRMESMKINAANIRAAMKRLDESTPRELQRTIKAINSELNSGRVKRGSEQWKFYTNQLKLVHAELKKVKEEMEETESFMTRFNRKMNDWGATTAAAIATFAGVTLAGKAAVQVYADMEAEEANVRKYTSMTKEQVAGLNEEFKKMDTRTAREELNRLAQEAGRLGKTSTEDVLSFVKASDQINVALDEIGKGATLELSKLTNIFGDEDRLGTEKALLSVGSVINELSQNCTAGAAYLVDYAQRMAGVGVQAHMTIPQIMSYAAVLDSQGQNVEAAATAMSQLIMKMYQDPAKIAKAAGMDVKEFSDILKKDANEALISLLKTLNSYGGIEKLATIFDEMGTDGARATASIAALAGQVDMLVWEQGEANKAFREATSVTKEYEVQNNTVEAQLDKARKGFTEMAVTLGEKLLPVMRYCISGTSMLMRVMNVLIAFFVEHKKAIGLLTIAIGSYWVAIKTVAAWQAVLNARIAAGIAISKTFLAVEQLLTAGMALMTGNTTKAATAWKLFNVAVKASPIGLVVSALATGITILASWISKNREAAAEEKRIASERKKQMSEFKNSLTSIAKAASENAAKETQKLKTLYEAATNVYKSAKKREEAARELQRIYPNTFKNLSTEKIMTGEAADEYLRLAKNIKEVAKAEAARDKIQANYKLQIDLELENEELADKLNEKDRQMEAVEKRISGLRSAAAGSSKKAAELKQMKEIHGKLLEESSELDRLMAENSDKMREAEKANKKLEKIVANAVKPLENTTETKIPATFSGETEKERKAREKAEKERKKQERALTAEQKKQLKERLEAVSAARHQENAVNLASYTSGQKNFLEYTEAKTAIEEKYIADSLAILEEFGKTDSEKYARLVEQREKLTQSSAERLRKASLMDVEQTHKGNENDIVTDYFDPNGAVFQNQKALNQRLLEEDLRYLQEKRDLYAEGSDEWFKINSEIEQRLAQDKLAKQQELAAALLFYSKKYQKLESEAREEAEIKALNKLHEIGLISETEYQRALNAIRARFRQEEKESRKQRTNERHEEIEQEFEDVREIMSGSSDPFGNALVDMRISWRKLMDDMKNEGEGMWNSFSDFANQALTLTSAMLSQYSSYADAERDLELAKIEKKYDKEIEAAGNNTKKIEQLEVERERETAKVKKKYNDRAMKVEIAQALAQTAVNAILGYQAGLEFPFPANTIMPQILAGLAMAQGAMQIAVIRKQHQAEAAGYYTGGFTKRDPDDRKEVGVVHANEFVANHQAVANPALSPILSLIDHAQRTNTIGSLTAEDVSNALGRPSGVSARGGEATAMYSDKAIAESIASLSVVSAANRSAIERLSQQIEDGISSYVVMDGSEGFHQKYVKYQKLLNNPKR
ncbi:MAG: phage tail tape measure protein [Staphylococcus sp.]|nr:phage tail tape measure protein [Staphylococcus sp.]